MGLVTRVVPDADVEREARDTAQRIADGAPLVARWHKKFARRLRDPRPLTPQEYDEGFACFGTEVISGQDTRPFWQRRSPTSREDDGMSQDKRCPWCLGSPAYIAYHDKEWGKPVHDDRVFFSS